MIGKNHINSTCEGEAYNYENELWKRADQKKKDITWICYEKRLPNN